MPANGVTEQGVSVGSAATSGQVRNVIATVMIGGVATPVLMQVVALADQNGNLLDMGLAQRLDDVIELLADIRRESMINNEIWSQFMGLQFPSVPAPRIDDEYRKDPAFTNDPNIVT